MIVALGAVALALLTVAWTVLRLATSIEHQASSVKTHGNQLALFGRAVYGSGGTSAGASCQDQARTVADPEAAERLAASEEARKSGSGT